MEARVGARTVERGSTALVLSKRDARATAGICADLLTAPGGDRRVLEIAYTRRPRQVIDEWQATRGRLPSRLAIVCPDRHSGSGETLPPCVQATAVSADDLTGVIVATSRYLDRWLTADATITACLDSLTAVVRRAEPDRAFRFLHTLTGRFAAAGAYGHVHLDPRALSEWLIATIRPLFDTVVSHEDGDWTIQRS